MKTRDSQTSDVIIIGGGATGAGIARDCALRGLRVILVATISPQVRPGATTACCIAVHATPSPTLNLLVSATAKTKF